MNKEKFNYKNIERIFYIWGRYSGTRDYTKEGKHYTSEEIKELVRRLNKFIENPDSFEEGFERETIKEAVGA